MTGDTKIQVFRCAGDKNTGCSGVQETKIQGVQVCRRHKNTVVKDKQK
jgi:hypothetical protein